MSVLQALDAYYGRMAARGEVAQPGWSWEPVGALLMLAADGSLIEVASRLTEGGKPQAMSAPKWFSRSGTASTPNFLWDNAAYVLGLGGAKDPAKTTRDHAAFRALHLEALAGETDPGLVAVRRFLEAWTLDQGPPAGLDAKLMAFNLSFGFEDEVSRCKGGNEVVLRPAVEPIVERLRTAKAAGVEGFCLVRGERLPLVTLHPKIKGVDGTASAEVPLVSFNAPAFESYGHEQGRNAPTSEIAAERYGKALNELLTRGGPNRLRVAGETVAFWADASRLEAMQAEDSARAAEAAFAAAVDPPAPASDSASDATDASEALKLEQTLKVALQGKPKAASTPEILDKVDFYVLGLAPNAARLSVRYWLTGRFERFADALNAHAEALEIEPRPWKSPPSVKLLLARTCALMGKFDNIPDGLAGEVLKAVLSNTPYPRTWFAAVLMRLHAGDDPSSGWHAAALKACINRISGEEKLPVALDPANPSAAYQLGRLFAVLESAQYAALGRVNASIKDRYYGAASSTPARVFGTLIRGGETHISDAKKRGRGLWIEPKITEIIGRLSGADLPRTLRMEDQARFAVGYYHERGTRPAKAQDAGDDVATAKDGEDA